MGGGVQNGRGESSEHFSSRVKALGESRHPRSRDESPTAQSRSGWSMGPAERRMKDMGVVTRLRRVWVPAGLCRVHTGRRALE